MRRGVSGTMDRTRSRVAICLAGALLASALAAGCGSGPGSTSVPGSHGPPVSERGRVVPSRTADGPPRPCVPAKSGTYSVAGHSYLLAVPPNPPAPLELLLDLHGYGQSAAAQERYTGFAAYAVAHGFAVATPNALTPGQWNFPGSTTMPDDVGFAERLVGDLRVRLCGVAAVGATGWSDGADMAMTLGCAGVVTAVAGVAASVFPVVTCPHPPPAVEIHGTADTFVPYEGGGGSRSGAYANTEAQAAEVRLGRWAMSAGCTEEPRRTGVASDVVMVTWGTCAVLYQVQAGGHTWPGHVGPEPVPGLGTTTSFLNANEVFVDFMQHHL